MPLPPPHIPRKPGDVQSGTFPPVPHDHPVAQEVCVFNVSTSDSLTLSITGSDFYKPAGGTVFDLNLEVIDPSELLHGHGAVRVWEEENPRPFDGTAPVPVTGDQRIHISVSTRVPAGSGPAPGPYTGTLVVRGQAT